MFGKKKDAVFFDQLCVSYYEKVLRYCCIKLCNQNTARDCTQETFLIALEKLPLLRQHPNPGGFLFQTAKNLIKEKHRERLRQLAQQVELEAEEAGDDDDLLESLGAALDQQIDETRYVEAVLAQLTDEKRRLYNLYYVDRKPMGEIARMLQLEEPALRMRYVRLRKEIRAIVAGVAEKHFYSDVTSPQITHK